MSRDRQRGDNKHYINFYESYFRGMVRSANRANMVIDRSDRGMVRNTYYGAYNLIYDENSTLSSETSAPTLFKFDGWAIVGGISVGEKVGNGKYGEYVLFLASYNKSILPDLIVLIEDSLLDGMVQNIDQISPIEIHAANYKHYHQISDPSNSSIKIASYKLIGYGSCLNFSVDARVRAVYRIFAECDRVVYFTDGVNPVRSINIDKPERFYVDINSSDPELDCAKLRLFDVGVMLPEIDVDVVDGGYLRVGAYYIAVRGIKEDGAKTNWTPLHGPIHIPEYSYREPIHRFRVGTFGNEAGKSIHVEVREIEPPITAIEIMVAIVDDDTAQPNKVYISPALNVNNGKSEFLISGDFANWEAGSFADLYEQKIVIDRAKYIAQLESRLVLANVGMSVGYDSDLFKNVVEKIRVGYVHVVNNVDSIVDGVSTPLSTAEGRMGNPMSPIYPYYRRGLMHGDNYIFGIVFIYKDGKKSPVYPILNTEEKTNDRTGLPAIYDGVIHSFDFVPAPNYNFSEYDESTEYKYQCIGFERKQYGYFVVKDVKKEDGHVISVGGGGRRSVRSNEISLIVVFESNLVSDDCSLCDSFIDNSVNYPTSLKSIDIQVEYVDESNNTQTKNVTLDLSDSRISIECLKEVVGEVTKTSFRINIPLDMLFDPNDVNISNVVITDIIVNQAEIYDYGSNSNPCDNRQVKTVDSGSSPTKIFSILFFIEEDIGGNDGIRNVIVQPVFYNIDEEYLEKNDIIGYYFVYVDKTRAESIVQDTGWSSATLKISGSYHKNSWHYCGIKRNNSPFGDFIKIYTHECPMMIGTGNQCGVLFHPANSCVNSISFIVIPIIVLPGVVTFVIDCQRNNQIKNRYVGDVLRFVGSNLIANVKFDSPKYVYLGPTLVAKGQPWLSSENQCEVRGGGVSIKKTSTTCCACIAERFGGSVFDGYNCNEQMMKGSYFGVHYWFTGEMCDEISANNLPFGTHEFKKGLTIYAHNLLNTIETFGLLTNGGNDIFCNLWGAQITYHVHNISGIDLCGRKMIVSSATQNSMYICINENGDSDIYEDDIYVSRYTVLKKDQNQIIDDGVLETKKWAFLCNRLFRVGRNYSTRVPYTAISWNGTDWDGVSINDAEYSFQDENGNNVVRWMRFAPGGDTYSDIMAIGNIYGIAKDIGGYMANSNCNIHEGLFLPVEARYHMSYRLSGLLPRNDHANIYDYLNHNMGIIMDTSVSEYKVSPALSTVSVWNGDYVLYDHVDKCAICKDHPYRIVWSEAAQASDIHDKYAEVYTDNFVDIISSESEITGIFPYLNALVVVTGGGVHFFPSSYRERVDDSGIVYTGSGEFLGLQSMKVYSAGSNIVDGLEVMNMLFIILCDSGEVLAFTSGKLSDGPTEIGFPVRYDLQRRFKLNKNNMIDSSLAIGYNHLNYALYFTAVGGLHERHNSVSVDEQIQTLFKPLYGCLDLAQPVANYKLKNVNGGSTTISYNPKIITWMSFHSQAPNLYVTAPTSMISCYNYLYVCDECTNQGSRDDCNQIYVSEVRTHRVINHWLKFGEHYSYAWVEDLYTLEPHHAFRIDDAELIYSAMTTPYYESAIFYPSVAILYNNTEVSEPLWLTDILYNANDQSRYANKMLNIQYRKDTNIDSLPQYMRAHLVRPIRNRLKLGTNRNIYSSLIYKKMDGSDMRRIGLYEEFLSRPGVSRHSLYTYNMNLRPTSFSWDDVDYRFIIIRFYFDTKSKDRDEIGYKRNISIKWIVEGTRTSDYPYKEVMEE